MPTHYVSDFDGQRDDESDDGQNVETVTVKVLTAPTQVQPTASSAKVVAKDKRT